MDTHQNQKVFGAIVALLGGSQAELLRKVNERLGESKPITAQAVGKWAKQIPANRVLMLVELTGGRISAGEMRPDVFGPPPGQPTYPPIDPEMGLG